MADVPMPRDLSEEAVAEWLYVNSDPFNESRVPWGGLYDGERNKWRFLARAVRALLREKVRECIAVTETRCHMPRFAPKDKAYGSLHPGATDDEIVARVLGEEAPRA